MSRRNFARIKSTAERLLDEGHVQKAIPHLITLLEANPRAQQDFSINMLARRGMPVLPRLIKVIKRPKNQFQLCGALAAIHEGQFRLSGKDLLSVLSRVDHKNPEVAEAAIYIAADHEAGLFAIQRALNHKNKSVRHDAIEALADYHGLNGFGDAAASVNALHRIYETPSFRNRKSELFEALGKLAHPSSIGFLVGSLADKVHSESSQIALVRLAAKNNFNRRAVENALRGAGNTRNESSDIAKDLLVSLPTLLGPGN